MKGTTFDGPFGDAEYDRDLFDAELLSIAQTEQFSLFKTQMSKGLAQLVLLLPAFQPGGRVGLVSRAFGNGGVQVNVSTIGARVVVESQAPGNGIEPGTEGARIMIGVCVAYQADKGFLY